MVDLIHTLTIERPFGVDDDSNLQVDLDEWRQPVREYDTDYATVQGLIQPKTAQEIALVSQAGTDVGSHTIYTLRGDITTRDRIRDAAGAVYEIVGIRDHNFGALAHFAIDAKRFDAPAVVIGS